MGVMYMDRADGQDMPLRCRVCLERGGGAWAQHAIRTTRCSEAAFGGFIRGGCSSL
jgi:hypothetical protein